MYEVLQFSLGVGAMAGVERVGVAGCLALLALVVVLAFGGLWMAKEVVRRAANEASQAVHRD